MAQMMTLDWTPGEERKRRLHHKVKTGCQACKLRREKCDERKPICTSCGRYSSACVYRPTKKQKQKLRLNDKKSNSATSTHRGQANTSITTNPSPARYLPVSPSSHINLKDLELFHHYITSTCNASGQLPEVTLQVQRTMPILGQEHPFLMRGMLAQAATHLSRLRPLQSTQYANLAAEHHAVALPKFRTVMQRLDAKNCLAVSFFAKKLLWCSMARDESLLENNPVEENWIPQWFTLLVGSCRIVQRSRAWICGGPFAVEEISDSLRADFANSVCCKRITDLRDRFMSMPTNLEDVVMYAEVLSALHESFIRSSVPHVNTPHRNGVNFWIDALPERYLALLHRKEPAAMVILAHFCVLLHRSEEPWFMRNHSTRLLGSIVDNLHPSWSSYVQWPCQQLLLYGHDAG